MSIRSSQRSSATASTSAQSSNRTTGTGTSLRSITSSVALEQLRQLDEVLMRERQAREEAERTLSVLQQERASKDAATRRTEKTERQLETILATLGRVLEHPEDLKKLRKLQRVAIEGATSVSNSSVGSSSSRSRSSVDSGSQRSSCYSGSGSSSCYSGSSYSSSSYSGSDGSRGSGSSSSSKRKEDRKAQMLSSGAAALLAAGGGGSNSKKKHGSSSSNNKFQETFFEKFGTGDDRQKRAIDRAYYSGNQDGIKAAGGQFQPKSNSPSSNKAPTILPTAGRRVDAKTMTNSSVAFTHHKSDLRPSM